MKAKYVVVSYLKPFGGGGGDILVLPDAGGGALEAHGPALQPAGLL